jgi:hypothetical protein
LRLEIARLDGNNARRRMSMFEVRIEAATPTALNGELAAF